MKHPLFISPLGIVRAKPSNLVGWQIICGEETSRYLPEMCYVKRKCVTDAPTRAAMPGPGPHFCPGTVSYHLLINQLCTLGCHLLRRLRSDCFVTTSILFLSDLEDYGDSMLAGQPVKIRNRGHWLNDFNS